jgi:hypothetical protein
MGRSSKPEQAELGRIHRMTAIRAIFDGKTFVPQQPVSLPEQSEALVIVEQNNPARREERSSLPKVSSRPVNGYGRCLEHFPYIIQISR